MPPPGPNFLAAAMAKGDDTLFQKKKGVVTYQAGDALTELYAAALRTPGFQLSVDVGVGRKSVVSFIPGHIWGQHLEDWQASIFDGRRPLAVDGPHPSDVMILGKMPWKEEIAEGRNLVGASGEILTEYLIRMHAGDARDWYVTNLCKFMPPEGSGTRIRSGWLQDCMPLLHAELRLVRPRYVLCLGADASKALMGPKATVSWMDGRVMDLRIPVHMSIDDEPEFHEFCAMTVLHPAEVARSPDKGRVLERGVSRFLLLKSGVRFDVEEPDIDHRVIDTLEDAEAWCEEVDAEFADVPKKLRIVAWDAEWHGQHPINPGSYLRTIQASWAEKKAVCFKISHAGGKPAFVDADGKPAFKRLMKLLQKFSDDKRACGHFLVSDLEWMTHFGFDPTKNCRVPLEDKDGKLAWQRFQDGEGWLDTGMSAHAIEETAQLGLEALTLRYTACPRYDVPLEEWKKEYCKEHDIAPAALEGYGDCPDEVLFRYANYDADGTRRLLMAQLPLLDSDYEGNCCWEPFWESMIIQPVLLKIHKNGMKVDRPLIDELTKNFLKARTAQEEKLRKWAQWAQFNIRSVQQVKEFLFGERLNGKRDKVTGETIRVRPAEAKSLYIQPLADTSKPPRLWSDLVSKGLADTAAPSTAKAVLAILAQENLEVADQINWLRDYRFLDQALKSVLRPPVEEEGKWVYGDDGFLEYEAGLAACIDVDGRVRTHLYPTTETGRWRSARPNLQNISKNRDRDYLRMLGKEGYKKKLRSIFVAEEGYSFVEFDYTGAELYMTAIASGSKKMQNHCERALLPESDPNYYDIHSTIAVLAFKLSCPPTKKGLEDAGKKELRNIAKTVIFGLMYGRGAKAIALAAKEQGTPLSVEEAQTLIDTIFKMYPELLAFFEAAKDRAIRQRWLCNAFGRFRRFPSAADYKMEGEFERQAMNFPIQSSIASVVDRGLAWLDRFIEQDGLTNEIRIVLQMHDAALLEVKHGYARYAIDLVKYAMVQMVPVYPTRLDGTPTGRGPYHLGLEFSVEKAWGGAKFTKEECEAYDIPVEFAAKA